MTEEIYEFTIIPQMERFYNEDNNWGVYTFITDDDIPQFKMCKLDPFGDNSLESKSSSLVGKMQQLTIGMEYKVRATMEYSDKYKSYNYVPLMVTTTIPKNIEQQTAFLKTLVTEKQAQNILTIYPNIVNDILENRDVDYTTIKGMSEFSWNKIVDKVLDNYVISDILIILQPLGVTFAIIKKLISDEPNPTLLKQKLLENPYIMTKIHGLGFKKVDDLALKLKPELRISEKRTLAYLRYYFNSIGEDSGNTWVDISILDSVIRDNINECYNIYEDLIARERDTNVFLYFDNNKVGLKNRYNKEMSILDILTELDTYKAVFDIDINNGIKVAEEEQGFKFTEEQKLNISKSCGNNVVLISGFAGTGKSTILRALLKIYNHYSIGCCAFSAKAAQRIAEATGYPASTIHRMLGYNKIDFLYNAENRLSYDVVVLDEASMVNVPIFYSLLSAIKEGAKVIICGDDGQLPPIGYGNVFHDLLNINKFNCCKLTKILRQAEKSGIITDSKKIRNNENPLQYPQLKVITGELQDMTYMFRDNREGIRELAIKLYMKTIENSNVDDTIIITPCKQSRTNSTEEINKIIQDKLFSSDIASIKYGNKEFKIGAKVIQRANNYKKNVFNGEMGYIVDIIKSGKTNIVSINFSGEIINFTQNELKNIELAYALTVHVTQGSGYQNVIAIIDNTHFKLLDSCLLYTALTRAKKKCLLISEPSAYQRCITYKASERQTWLGLIKKCEI